MRKKSSTLVCRLSMSLTAKTPARVVLTYDLPRGPAVDRGKVMEVAQMTAQAEAPHAALAARPSTEAASDPISPRRFPTVDQGFWCGLCRFVMKWVAELGMFWCCCLFKEGPL